jgi:S-adenosylmethionine hydrolase
VVLAVVDPGVGTARPGVAVKVRNGYLVGPDNGLLAPAAHRAGPIEAVYELADDARGTFAGRDVFAPAAARLAAGDKPSGPERLTKTILGEPVETPELTDGGLKAQVLWVDRFGNAQLNVGVEEIPEGDLTIDGQAVRLVHTYAELEDDETGLVVDSYGLVSVVRNRAASGLNEGDAVTMRSR